MGCRTLLGREIGIGDDLGGGEGTAGVFRRLGLAGLVKQGVGVMERGGRHRQAIHQGRGAVELVARPDAGAAAEDVGAAVAGVAVQQHQPLHRGVGNRGVGVGLREAHDPVLGVEVLDVAQQRGLVGDLDVQGEPDNDGLGRVRGHERSSWDAGGGAACSAARSAAPMGTVMSPRALV